MSACSACGLYQDTTRTMRGRDVLVRKRICRRTTHIFISPSSPRRIGIHVCTRSEGFVVIIGSVLRDSARRWWEASRVVFLPIRRRCISTRRSVARLSCVLVRSSAWWWRKAGWLWIIGWLACIGISWRRLRGSIWRRIVGLLVRIVSLVFCGAYSK